MVQLTRIYTRGGDAGKSSLGDGKRLSKSHIRFEAIGHVDEANSAIGVARLETSTTQRNIDTLLNKVQNDLFDVGADLCMPDMEKTALRIAESQIVSLEEAIDHYNAELLPLNSFVLPGGSSFSAYLHLARSIVRRAERAVVALHKETPVNPDVIKYLNRLSDLLFVLARYANHKGEGDVLWIPGANR